MITYIKDIIRYRELVVNLAKTELKLKYKNSALGFLWSFANPLMMTIIYTFAFKTILKNPEPNYGFFILTALLPWMFFQSSVVRGTYSIVYNAGLIKKVYFPREIIPISFTLANFINFLSALFVFFIILIFSDVVIGWPLIFFPIVLVLLLIFTSGLVLLFSALHVIFRDIAHLVEVFFMGLFYLTPIVYTLNMVPETQRIYLYLNPLTLFMKAIRGIVMRNEFPSLGLFTAMTICSVGAFYIGSKVFQKLQKVFAEEI